MKFQVLLVIVIVAAVIGGLVYNRSHRSSPAATQMAADTFAFTVQGDTVNGPQTLSAVQGQKVVINLTADRDDELHLHGYDLKRQFKANEPVKLEFVATQAGRFELEFEDAKKTLGFLEISPK